VEALAALNGPTMELYDALQADGVLFEMNRSGLLFVFKSERDLQQEFEVVVSPKGGEPPKRLTGDQVRAMEPAVSQAVTGGFWIKSDRHVRPESLTSGLVNWLSNRNVELLPNTAVTGISRQGTRIKSLLTSCGPLEADYYLLAGGAWSGALANQLGLRLPVQAGKGYSITMDQPGREITRPLYFGEAKVGCSPFRNALRFAGTMELSGVNTTLHRRRMTAIRKAANEYLTNVNPEKSASEWVGMRPITPDGLPIMGPAPGLDNFHVATGHGMLGITLAPATAAAIADLISGRKPELDLTPFHPARFGKGV
jgi:D-amino-acid dehydrogenase